MMIRDNDAVEPRAGSAQSRQIPRDARERARCVTTGARETPWLDEDINQGTLSAHSGELRDEDVERALAAVLRSQSREVPPPMSARERAERRAGDLQLTERLARTGFQGPEWDKVMTEFKKRSFRVLLYWISTGQIGEKYVQARGRKPLKHPRGPRLDLSDCAQVAIEAVGLAEKFFQRTALPKGYWRPDGGASLLTYFTKACVLHYPQALEYFERDDGLREAIKSEFLPSGILKKNRVGVARGRVARVLLPGDDTVLDRAEIDSDAFHARIDLEDLARSLERTNALPLAVIQAKILQALDPNLARSEDAAKAAGITKKVMDEAIGKFMARIPKEFPEWVEHLKNSAEKSERDERGAL